MVVNFEYTLKIFNSFAKLFPRAKNQTDCVHRSDRLWVRAQCALVATHGLFELSEGFGARAYVLRLAGWHLCVRSRRIVHTNLHPETLGDKRNLARRREALGLLGVTWRLRRAGRATVLRLHGHCWRRMMVRHAEAGWTRRPVLQKTLD